MEPSRRNKVPTRLQALPLQALCFQSQISQGIGAKKRLKALKKRDFGRMRQWVFERYLW